LPKHYYKPILSVIEETYKENAQKDYSPGLNVEESVRIIVEAEEEKTAYESLYGFVDIRMWELEKTED
jgi:hypothetical protein